MNAKPEKVWAETKYSHLLRNTQSGIYYARVRLNGKLIRKSLKTTRISVAKLRKDDFLRNIRPLVKERGQKASDNLTFEQLADELLSKSKSDYNLKTTTKKYHSDCINVLRRQFKKFSQSSVSRISKADCEELMIKLSESYSPTRFNGILTILNRVFALANEKGLRYDNPCSTIKRAKVKSKHLVLPTDEQFKKLLEVLEAISPEGAKLIRFISYSGCRINEARNVLWKHIEEKKLIIVGDPHERTKNSEIRYVPIIPQMRTFLDSIRPKSLNPESPVLITKHCRKALATACKQIGIKEVTHHDFRHYFATRCIEAGVDIPTISKWLGHKDGGALALKVYGHLRDDYSQQQAESVII